MHPLLERQLKRLGLGQGTPPSGEEWDRWLEQLSATYTRVDDDRELLERSLAISSREMGELNDSLRESERALRGEHARLGSMIACLEEGLCLFDSEGRVVFLNPEAQRLLGRPECPGESGLLDSIAPGVDWSQRPSRGGDQVTFRHSDGSEFPVSCVLSAVEGGGSVLAFRDISELVRARTQLERSHYQMQAIIRSAPIAMAMLDRSMRYIAFSERWLSDWRLKGSGIVGKSHFDVFPDIPDDWRAIYRKALSGEICSVPEEAIQRADGSVIHVRWAAHPWLSLDGEIGGIVLASDRVDDLIRAREAALEGARMKAQFLANMSHEIRTPMNGVIGMAELMLGGDLMDDQREYAETIYESADNLLRIINEILDFSKLEAGRVELEVVDFEPRALLRSVVDLLAERAQNKSIEIACFSYQDVPRSLRGDPGRLRQVLVNLVGNAVKFTEQGNVTLTLRHVGETTKGPMLRFEVEDTGIGIDPAARRRVFDAFTQADGSTTRKYGGSGLGLAISKQLVETMGGTIDVESEPGRGSCFSLTVPFAVSESQGEPPVQRVGLSGLRALAVDDNPVNRRILELQCASWGVEIDLVDGADGARELLDQSLADGRPYDLMLVDYAMPDTDGMQLAESLRDDERFERLKLVLLSSMVERSSAEAIAQAGFAGYMTKPLHEQVLFDTLRSVMGTEQSCEPVAQRRLIDLECMLQTDFRRRQRVLLVEDNAVNRKVAVHMLERLGCTVDVAENGWRAVEAIRQNSYQVVFMDCQMPGLDGFEATRIVRGLERDSNSGHTTIVALTAHAMAGDRERCLEAGMDEYLTKPLKIEVLSECLRTLARRAS